MLAHPHTGIIFAFAAGTHTYVLRLPEAVRQEALAAGAPLEHVYSGGSRLAAEGIGPEWLFGFRTTNEARWCRAAFDSAGEAASQAATRRLLGLCLWGRP